MEDSHPLDPRTVSPLPRAFSPFPFLFSLPPSSIPAALFFPTQRAFRGAEHCTLALAFISSSSRYHISFLPPHFPSSPYRRKMRGPGGRAEFNGEITFRFVMLALPRALVRFLCLKGEGDRGGVREGWCIFLGREQEVRVRAPWEISLPFIPKREKGGWGFS